MKEFFNDLVTSVSVHSKLLLWSAMFGFFTTLFSDRNRSVIAYIMSICTAMPVGALTGVMLYERGFSVGDTYFAVALAALLCQDLLKFIFSATGFIRKNQETLFKAVFDFALRKFKTKNRKGQD